MLHARLLAFPPEARRVLRAASVFGARPTRRGVERVLGVPPDDPATAALLEGLCAAEVLEPRAGEGSYGWRHLLLRDAAYSLFLDEDRQQAHRLAAERDPEV
jgi:predicted ATPase